VTITVKGGRIVVLDSRTDPDRLGQLDLIVVAGRRFEFFQPAVRPSLLVPLPVWRPRRMEYPHLIKLP